jgi:hypothetical protein
MVCLRNIYVDILHKGETEDDDDDNNNNNNNNNDFTCKYILTSRSLQMAIHVVDSLC